MTQVSDDVRLLDALLNDGEAAPQLYKPTDYWRPYAERITQRLRTAGLRNFRNDATILKGYSAGGVARPSLPRAAWKRAVWYVLTKAPGVREIVGEYERLVGLLDLHWRNTEQALALQVMESIAAKFPDLKIPNGIGNGGAKVFHWRDNVVTPEFVAILSRAADFYAKVAPHEVTSIVEIGPGLGLSTLAHIALNPSLRVIVNVDIVPVIYISTRFLASSSSVEVVDYLTLRHHEQIIPEAGEKPRIYSIPTWMLKRVKGPVDFAFNAFSFQEMEEDVCANYAAELSRFVRHGLMLHSAIAEGPQQHRHVPMSFLRGLFERKFPRVEQVSGLWTSVYYDNPGTAILMRP